MRSALASLGQISTATCCGSKPARQRQFRFEALKIAKFVRHVIRLAGRRELGHIERDRLTVLHALELQLDGARHPPAMHNSLNQQQPQQISTLAIARQYLEALYAQARDAVLRGDDALIEHELFFLRLNLRLQLAQRRFHLRVRGAIDVARRFRDRELPAQLVADATLLGQLLARAPRARGAGRASSSRFDSGRARTRDTGSRTRSNAASAYIHIGLPVRARHADRFCSLNARCQRRGHQDGGGGGPSFGNASGASSCSART